MNWPEALVLVAFFGGMFAVMGVIAWRVFSPHATEWEVRTYEQWTGKKGEGSDEASRDDLA